MHTHTHTSPPPQGYGVSAKMLVWVSWGANLSDPSMGMPPNPGLANCSLCSSTNPAEQVGGRVQGFKCVCLWGGLGGLGVLEL